LICSANNVGIGIGTFFANPANPSKVFATLTAQSVFFLMHSVVHRKLDDLCQISRMNGSVTMSNLALLEPNQES